MLASTASPEDSPLELFTLALTLARDPASRGKDDAHLTKRLQSTVKQATRVLQNPNTAKLVTAEAIHLAYLMKTVSGFEEKVQILREGPIDPDAANRVLEILGEAA
jgi:hypothetical protein